MNRVKIILTVGLVTLLVCQLAFARDNVNSKIFQSQNSAAPAYGITQHRIGNISIGINNNGTLGTGFSQTNPIDYFTGETVQSSNFPSSSSSSFLFGGTIWVGAVVGSDTLVSVGADGWQNSFEFAPESEPFGGSLKYRSTLYPENDSIFNGAVSEEDYIAVYYDTLTAGVQNDYFGRPHIPMNLEITQKSYAWSFPYAQDIVLIQYDIKNIGNWVLNDVYIGIFMDQDVGDESSIQYYFDDISGFMQTYDFPVQDCEYTDSLNIAWIADNNGDPVGGVYGTNSVRSVTGMSFIRSVFQDPHITYNWYISNANPTNDFGPREKSGVGLWQEDFRDFQTGGLGTPSGDVNKYYMMKNQEIDYDQIYTASITENDPLWMYPENQAVAANISDGSDARYLLSIGPGQLAPGETLPVIVAYIGGENFHTNPTAINNLPGNPEAFYNQLNFEDLAYNARWAEWIYDNPGVDTDGDGYFGQYIVCNNDTNWITGDGVPDFKAAGPPAPPQVRYEPTGEQLTIRWNGLHPETTPDFLTRSIDFEGYNVYLQNGTDELYAKYASYDKEDYAKFIWSFGNWSLRDHPFTIEELRCLYGSDCNDLSFDPTIYTESAPFVHPIFSDSIFYFAPVGENNSELGISTPIVKTYPSQPYPTSLNPDDALPSEITDDGYLKYFEYEITIDLNQNYSSPSMCYKASVTSFDYGSYFANTPPQESSKDWTEFSGCVDLKAGLEPETMYYFMANSIEPVTATFKIGFDDAGIPGKAVDYNSFELPFTFDSILIEDSPTGFTGNTAVMYFSLNDYLLSMDPPFGTTVFDEIVNGSYSDGQETNIHLHYTLIGHRLGDLNLDNEIDISDLVYFIGYMFEDGPPPRLPETADFNSDGAIDIVDLIAMVKIIFN